MDGSVGLDEKGARFLEIRSRDRAPIAKAQISGLLDGGAELLREAHRVERYLQRDRRVGCATALVVEDVEAAVGIDVGTVDASRLLN